MNRIKTFQEHKQSLMLNEGLISWIKSKISKLSGWAKDFYEKVEKGMFKRVPSGPDKGKPVVMFFDAKGGSFEDQIMAWKNQRLEESVNLEEAVIPLEYTGEDQSVRNINAEELVDEIKFLWRSNERGGRGKPIFIYGAPGIGKTQIVAQAADQLRDAGVNSVIFMDLQFMSPEDFKGVPSVVNLEEPGFRDNKFSPGKGMTISNVPYEFPQKGDGRRGVIFMDEMNRANEVVQNSLMNFIQSGRIGMYQMVKTDWIIIAAGNRPEEAPTVRDFDFALADRFKIVNYVPELGIDRNTYEIKGGWAKWAQSKNILPELIYFLADKNELFHKLDTDKKVINFPTPRSWADGALILKDWMEDKGVSSWRELPMSDIRNVFFDQVGPEAAGAFVEYLEIVKLLTKEDLRQILDNPESGKMPAEFKKQKRFIYGLGQSLLGMANGDPEKLYNLIVYISRYEQNEILTWILKRIYDRYPDFKRFDKSFSDEPGWEYKNKAAKLVAEIKNKIG